MPRRRLHDKTGLSRVWFKLLLAVILIFVASFIRNSLSSLTNEESSSSSLTKAELSSPCPSLMHGLGVPTFKFRNDLGTILQNEGFTRGIELGVQRGVYSKIILTEWISCTDYHLIDLWAPQENYLDVANINQNQQDKNYEAAMEELKPWEEKIHVCRNYTTSCVHNFDDEFFDFIYVDARHDFKGVFEDLTHYWPKLRVGGIMAGHDYVTQKDIYNNQDWTKNYDGTVDETGTVIKGAVDKFAASVCRQVTVSYREVVWNTWAIRK